MTEQLNQHFSKMVSVKHSEYIAEHLQDTAAVFTMCTYNVAAWLEQVAFYLYWFCFADLVVFTGQLDCPSR